MQPAWANHHSDVSIWSFSFIKLSSKTKHKNTLDCKSYYVFGSFFHQRSYLKWCLTKFNIQTRKKKHISRFRCYVNNVNTSSPIIPPILLCYLIKHFQFLNLNESEWITSGGVALIHQPETVVCHGGDLDVKNLEMMVANMGKHGKIWENMGKLQKNMLISCWSWFYDFQLRKPEEKKENYGENNLKIDAAKLETWTQKVVTSSDHINVCVAWLAIKCPTQVGERLVSMYLRNQLFCNLMVVALHDLVGLAKSVMGTTWNTQWTSRFNHERCPISPMNSGRAPTDTQNLDPDSADVCWLSHSWEVLQMGSTIRQLCSLEISMIESDWWVMFVTKHQRWPPNDRMWGPLVISWFINPFITIVI